MKVSHQQLMLGAKLSFAECFKMEYRISQECMVRINNYSDKNSCRIMDCIQRCMSAIAEYVYYIFRGCSLCMWVIHAVSFLVDVANSDMHILS